MRGIPRVGDCFVLSGAIPMKTRIYILNNSRLYDRMEGGRWVTFKVEPV